ncbi:hypothetical protein D3C80_448540 [compost metagenome]
MRLTDHTWDSRLLLLSPKEQKQFWLDELKRRQPHGMAVNCRHMPSLNRTPILRKLIEDGLILRSREYRSNKCFRTVLRLPECQ